MHVGVVADSHGRLEPMLALAEKAGRVDTWLHLGDFARDAEYLPIADKSGIYAVRGNCDMLSPFDSELVVTLGGVRIFMTHGNMYSPVYDRMALYYRCEELNCSVVLYGHTHVSIVEKNGGILAVNPGSTSFPRGGHKPSIALLDINDGEVMPRIITMSNF